MTGALCLGLVGGLLILPAALAQSKDDVASAVTIDAKVRPHGLFWMLPPYLDELEITFTIDENSADFSVLEFQCDYLGKDDQKTSASMWGSITRSQFKPSSAGRLVARRLPSIMPGGGLTGAECRIVEVKK